MVPPETMLRMRVDDERAVAHSSSVASCYPVERALVGDRRHDDAVATVCVGVERRRDEFHHGVVACRGRRVIIDVGASP